METTLAAFQSQKKDDFLFFGTIKRLEHIRGFGFIKAESGDDVYFRYKPVFEQNLEEGDFVVYKKVSDKFTNKEHACSIMRAYRSKDGFVITDRQDSHVHDNLTAKLPEIIGELTCNDQKTVVQEICFPYIIGKTKCVEVTNSDKIVYARRIGRNGSTKFVMNRTCPPSDRVSIVIRKNRNHYEISTCYVGAKSEVEPYDGKATDNSFLFWKNHALIYKSEPIDQTTVSAVCPWPKTPLKNFYLGDF